MRKIVWMMTAILVCGLVMTGMTSCRDNADNNSADGIPAENYKGKTYTIQHPGKYQYYALQIFDNWGDRYMQLGGFRFDQWEK